MIVKMQKIALLVSARERETALERLRDLGVVHIDLVENPISEDIHILQSGLDEVDRVLQVLGDAHPSQDDAGLERLPANPRQFRHPRDGVANDRASADLQQISALARRRDELMRELEEGRRQYRWFLTWGAVSPASLQRLREAGIAVRFYKIDKSALENVPADAIVHIAQKDHKTVYIAYIAESGGQGLDFEEEEIPSIEPAALAAEIARLEGELEEVDSALGDLSKNRGTLLAYRTGLEKELEFNRVKYSMGEEGHIAYLRGFCPVDYISQIEDMAHREGWGCIAEEPDDPDEVPTLIRIPRWLRMIDPVFKFMGTLPGYKEYDISFWFLLFFSLFFALLIGDAGYGMAFLSVSAFLARKFKTAPREPFVLMYALSSATILWGAVSGTWFGYERIAQLPFFKTLVVDQVNSFVDANQSFMMFLCFIIGVVHLTIARLLAFFRYINSLVALAELGWIAILWALFFVAGNLVLGRPIPGFAVPALVVGITLVIFFSHPQKNVLKGALRSLADLPLKVIGSFSDIVSYLRLFAVGYASVIVASSFNDMALRIGFDSVFGSLLAAGILFLGHSINIVLGMMAVVVHGIRLNMLEFSGHLNMQWSGKTYRPFKT